MSQFKKHHLHPWGLDIVNKYPLIFTESDDCVLHYTPQYDPEERVNLRFGFEHGQGWSKLIEDLAQTGTELVEDLRIHPITIANLKVNPKDKPYIHGFICKEKFGGLRWQGSSYLPEPYAKLWYAFVKDIERQSYQTCEVTGTYGELCRTKSNWAKTLCFDEAEKLGYDYPKERV